MAIQKMQAQNDYDYMPLVPGKSFWDYNLEEQAEMVRDRWELEWIDGRWCNAPRTQCGYSILGDNITSLFRAEGSVASVSGTRWDFLHN